VTDFIACRIDGLKAASIGENKLGALVVLELTKYGHPEKRLTSSIVEERFYVTMRPYEAQDLAKALQRSAKSVLAAYKRATKKGTKRKR
jgi:hypothetical protein